MSWRSLLDVSTQTVRRDIRKLSEQGLITRHHGGAGRASSVVNTAFEQREVSLTEEKKAIAEAVADYIPMARRCLSPLAPPLSRLPARC
jgi:DeoR/GlpR family transcriptional regulator of sugar metabolism